MEELNEKTSELNQYGESLKAKLDEKKEELNRLLEKEGK